MGIEQRVDATGCEGWLRGYFIHDFAVAARGAPKE